MRDRIESFLKEKDISQNKFASIIGVSSSYISQYMKVGSSFKYAKSIEEKAKEYLDNYIEKKDTKDKDEFMLTRDARSIFFVIEMAIEENDMPIIVGRAGLGKSRAVEEFASKHPECILIESTIQTNARDLFKNIAKRVGIPYVGTLDSIVRECAVALKKSDKVLIIDEAEHLPYRALELLRRLHDFSKIPLVLAGTHRLIKNLIGNDMDGNEYEQLSSRIGGKWILEGLCYVQEKDNKSVENIDDLRLLCARYGIEDKDSISVVKQLTKGNFRKSIKLLKRAERLARNYENVINKEVIETASKMLLLG